MCYHLCQETEYNTGPSNGSDRHGKNVHGRDNRRSEAPVRFIIDGVGSTTKALAACTPPSYRVAFGWNTEWGWCLYIIFWKRRARA